MKKAAMITAAAMLAAGALIVSSVSDNSPKFSINWTRGGPMVGPYFDEGSNEVIGDWSNVWTVVIRTHDVTVPTYRWEKVYITRGTNYSEPRTNDMFFYAIYNYDTNTGLISSLGGTPR